MLKTKRVILKWNRNMMKAFVACIVALIVLFQGCKKNEYDNPYDSSVDKELWAPKELIVNQTSLKTAELKWKQEDLRIDSFRIESKRGDQDWKVIGYSPKNSLVYIDSTFIPDPKTPIQYKVSAVAWKNTSGDASNHVIPVFNKPYAPIATHVPGIKIIVRFDDIYQNEDSYKIEKRVNGGSWILCADTIRKNSTFYFDTSPELNTKITYRISVKAAGIYSDTTSGNTVNTTLYPPTWFRVAGISPASCKLDWFQGDSWTTGYRIDRQFGTNPWQDNWKLLDSALTTYTDTNLPVDQDVKYRISTIVNNNASPTTELIYGFAQLDTITASNIKYSTATVKTVVKSEPGSPVSEWGFVYGTSPDPTISNTRVIATTAGNIPFTANLTGLLSGKTYYIRPYAMNKRGESYGKQKTITLLPNTLPQLDKVSFPYVTYDYANVSGNIITDGGFPILDAGFVFATHPAPTISDRKAPNNFTSCPTGTCSFSSYLQYLFNNETNYVRSYATNSLGLTYGPESVVPLLTYPLPVIDTLTILKVEATRVQLSSHLLKEGGGWTTKGFVYGKTINPTVNDNRWYEPTNNGLITYIVTYFTGLKPNQTYHARAYSQNMAGYVYSPDKAFTTTGISAPRIDTLKVGSITYSSAIATSQVNSDGGDPVIEAGFVYSANPDPTINDNKYVCTLVAPDNNMRFTMSSLPDGQTYNIRSFARNSQGITYSQNVKFTTLGYTLPQLSWLSITGIAATTAYFYCELFSTGGDPLAEAGFVYGDNPGPTIADNKVLSEPGWSVHYTGANKLITNLQWSHKYYARAYLKNVKGIVYSADNYFWTKILEVPTITSNYVVSTTANSIKLYSFISSDGGSPLIETGFVYATTPDPTIINNKIVVSGAKIGFDQYEFNGTLTGLTQGQTYYIRSFGTNLKGTTYGPEVIKTLP